VVVVVGGGGGWVVVVEGGCSGCGGVSGWCVWEVGGGCVVVRVKEGVTVFSYPELACIFA
jgi:hypothetical protein